MDFASRFVLILLSCLNARQFLSKHFSFDKPYDAISRHHKSTENAKTLLSIRLDKYICGNIIQEKSWNHDNMSTLHRGLQNYSVRHNCIEISKSSSSYDKLNKTLNDNPKALLHNKFWNKFTLYFTLLSLH